MYKWIKNNALKKQKNAFGIIAYSIPLKIATSKSSIELVYN